MADPEGLFTASHSRLFRYFCRAVGGAETERDLTQEVFLRVSRTAIREDADGDSVAVPAGAKTFEGRPCTTKAVSLRVQGGVEVTLETIRGRADPGQEGYQAANYFRSTVHIKPNEIVEVALRQPDE